LSALGERGRKGAFEEFAVYVVLVALKRLVTGRRKKD